MRIDSFGSLKNYLSFVAAKEFRHGDNPDQKFPASAAEKITNCLLTPVQVPADYILKNFNQPIFIVALNVIGVSAVTLSLYPEICFQTLGLVCSPFFHLEPWMPKSACFIFGETMITSLMVRTLARCDSKGELLTAWEAKKIFPIHLGTRNIN